MSLSKIVYPVNRIIEVIDEKENKIGSFSSYSLFEEIKGKLYEKPIGNILEILVDYLKKLPSEARIRNKIPYGVKREIRDETGEERLFQLNEKVCEYLKERGIQIEC
jgi:hypothetical protein